jgi:TRAP-type C4-dicarboxylate transport system substrate-binding protein
MSSLEKAQLAYQAQWEWINTVPEVKAEYKDFKLLWPFQLDSYRLFIRMGGKKVHKAEDFNGQKVGGSGVKMELVTANGGASVHVIPPQSYMNYEKGIIDSGFFTFSQVWDYKLCEVCDYFYAQDFGGGCIIVTMNWNAWNAMSPEDQKIMEDSWADATVECVNGSLEDDTLGKQYIKDSGMEITYPTPEEITAWEEDNYPAVDKWMNDARAAGIADPYSFLKKWKDIRAKYIAKMK